MWSWHMYQGSVCKAECIVRLARPIDKRWEAFVEESGKVNLTDGAVLVLALDSWSCIAKREHHRSVRWCSGHCALLT